MSKSRPVLDYQSPRDQTPSPRGPAWLLIAAVALATGTVGYYTWFAPQLPVSFLYRLLTDGIILLLWLCAATGAGWTALRLFHVEHAPSGLRLVTAAALGLGIISLATLGLGLAGWLNRGTAIGLLLACASPGTALLARKLARNRRASPCHPVTLSPCHFVTLSPCLLLIPLLLTALIGGLVYPGFLWGADDPAGYDVVEYHLQIPREWYEMGRIVPLHHNVFSYFPFNVEMQYLLAMHLRGGPWEGMYLAQWMHLAYIVLAVAGIGAAAKEGRPRTLAILAAGSCAWLTMLGAVAYNEGGLLLYGTLAIAWMLHGVARASSPCDAPHGQDARATGEDHGRVARAAFAPAALAGVMAGLAAGCKLTAVPMLIIALPVAMAFAMPRAGRNLILPLGVFMLAATITLCPWLIRNQIWAGNPVFPEAMTLLGQAHFTDAQVERWNIAHAPRAEQKSLVGRLQAAWSQIAADWRYGFVPFPLCLVAVGLTIRRRETRLLLALLTVIALFWLFATHLQSRFFVLAIPVMALLIAGGNWRTIQVSVLWLLMASAGLAIATVCPRLGDFGQAVDADGAQLSRDLSTSIVAHDYSNGPMITLVGEARAFLFRLPISRLRYRTVFDVPATSEQQHLDNNWLEGWPLVPGSAVRLNGFELERFHLTYRRLGVAPFHASGDLIEDERLFRMSIGERFP